MPSPFRGMDPYLEGALWGNVHHQLIAEIARQLVPLLRPRYIALSQERFVTVMPEPNEGLSIVAASGGAALAAPMELATIIPERVPQVTLEIRDQASRELVTAIEVLSPTNKRSDGRDEYLQKRAKYLSSRAHLVEIDLLRSGQRVPMAQPLPDAPYFALVSRAWKRPVCDVWPIRLEDRLPTIGVPLLGRDEEVPLDLQAALGNVYDQCGLELAVDYSKPPDVTLTAQEMEWTRGLVARR